MTPKTIRLIVGFLAGFVLISLAPTLPDLLTQLGAAPTIELPVISDTMLLVIGGGVVLLGLLVLRRQQRARAPRPAAASASRAVARPAVTRPAPRVRPERSSPQPSIASPLQIRLRTAAGKGERIAALARRNGLSVDAVRAALGTSHAPAPAARSGSSFRSTPPSLPAKPRSRPVSSGRNRYVTAG